MSRKKTNAIVFTTVKFIHIICLRIINSLTSLKNILPSGRSGRPRKNRGRSVFREGPKCLLLGAKVSFHEGPKCLDEGPKCLFEKGPKGPKW